MITRGFLRALSIAGLMASFAATGAARGGGIEDGWRCANTPDNPRLAINYCVRAIYSGDLSQDQLAATFYNRGFEYGKAGDHDLAIKDFQAAIDLRPGFSAALNSLAVAYMDKGEEAIAIEALGDAIKKSPNDALLYRNRAMLRLYRGEFSAALIDIEAACGGGWTADRLRETGERIWNIERLFNLGAGFTAADDTLPERILKQPAPQGSAKGRTADLSRLLPEYYALRGWDENGVPTAETLHRLGLA